MSGRTKTLLTVSLLYGVIAFAIGFVFGALRQLLFIPTFGETMGHWVEFPLVTGAIVAVGWWLAQRHRLGLGDALVIGLGGVATLLAIESAFAVGLLGMSAEEYFATFNIFDGALFPYGLVLMAVAPWLSQMLRRST